MGAFGGGADRKATPADLSLYLQVANPSLTVDMYALMRDEYSGSHLDLFTAYPNRTQELMQCE